MEKIKNKKNEEKESEKRLIQKVWKRKKTNQKMVSIPKKHPIEEGDYVEIKKVSEDKK